ncbi:MAG TPA: helix-turn-helix transcriptional regulator, partial [Ktedonobacteraceae bacterium]|nr:helix-turn-helix transcriptional regulator [Ktedonobacteraceae bacterium]
MIHLRVKEVAKAKGFSQGELSRRANIDENTLKRIYRNPTAVITTETLDKLAKALGVDASVLIESVPDEFEGN